MSEEQPPAGAERFGSGDGAPRLPDRPLAEAERFGYGDRGPRLPDHPPPDFVRRGQLTFDLAGASTSTIELVRKQPEWSDYEEPKLLPRVATRRVFLATRGLAAGWAIAMVLAAIITRSNARGAIDDGALVRLLGWFGIGVVVLVAVSGWWWADRVTRNVHRLEARLPSRTRCVSAWAAPLIWTGLLSVTVLQIEPSDIFDVRPSIIVPIFLAAMWRPAALVRRILSSLIRIGSDALVGAVFVLDVAGFGLLWWRLSTWPSRLDPSNVSTIEVLIGLAAVAAISLAGSTAAWAVLLRDVDRAEHHRTVAVRTRFDHRQLRLRGIDPLDPDVRWAMLRLRREEEQARAAEFVGVDAEPVITAESVDEEDFEFEAAVWLEEAGLLRRRPAWSPVADGETTLPEIEVERDDPSLFEFDLDGAMRVVPEPDVDVPEVDVPAVDVPEVDVPEVDVPEVDAPEVDASEVDAPEVEAPEVDAPEVDASEVDVPEVEAPEVDASAVDAPEVDAPEVEAPDDAVEPIRSDAAARAARLAARLSGDEPEPVEMPEEVAPGDDVEPIRREAITRAARLIAQLDQDVDDVDEPDSVESRADVDAAATVDVVESTDESSVAARADAEPDSVESRADVDAAATVDVVEPTDESSVAARADAEPDSVESRADVDAAATVDVVEPTDESSVAARADDEPALPSDSLAERLASRMSDAPESGEVDRLDRLASRMSDAPESGEVDRLDRLAGRLSATASEEPPAAKSLLLRLEALGITPDTHSYEAESLIRPADRTRENSEPEPELVNPRAYGLELARYLLLMAMTATAVTAAWMLTRSVAAGDQLVGGVIDETDVERIDLARRSMVLATGVMLALVPLWATLVSVHARRAGVPDTHHRRCLALFAVAVAANVASFVFDGGTRSTVSFLCILGCLAIVPLSMVLVMSIMRWIELRTSALMVWSVGLAIMVATLWIGRLNRPIEPTDALEVLSFFSGLLAVTAGVVVVVAVMNTETIEDTLRLLPAAEDEPPAPGEPEPVREVVAAG